MDKKKLAFFSLALAMVLLTGSLVAFGTGISEEPDPLGLLHDLVREDETTAEAAQVKTGTDKTSAINENVIAASVLGITEEALVTSLNSSSLYQLLENGGKLAEYKNALINAQSEMVDAMIASGEYDTASAIQKIIDYAQTIKDWDGTTVTALVETDTADSYAKTDEAKSDKYKAGKTKTGKAKAGKAKASKVKTDMAKVDMTSAHAIAAHLLGIIPEDLVVLINETNLYQLLVDKGWLEEFKTELITTEYEMVDAKIASGEYDITTALQKITICSQTINDWDGTEELDDVLAELRFGIES